MRYHWFVFVRRDDLGVSLRLGGESTALGDGEQDLAYIIASHHLVDDNLIYINDCYYYVRDGIAFRLLEGSDFSVDGEPWSQAVANRLAAMQ